MEQPNIETWLVPAVSDRVQRKGMHRIMENAKRFIAPCIIAGMTDSTINEKQGQGLTPLYPLFKYYLSKMPVRASNLPKVRPVGSEG